VSKDQRKACLQAAIVCDGVSGFAYQPELGKPEESSGDLLVRAILGAIRSGRFVPREVCVRRREFKTVLNGLTEKLGLVVRVKSSLPHLDPFKAGLLALVGDPGEISAE
jgi:hypothetical protein